MEVITAKTAGFCFGVERAVHTVTEEITKAKGPIYTYGPIVHNDLVVNSFAEQGVKVIGPDDIESLDGGTVIIRAHGVAEEVYRKLEKRNLTIVDATCPFVARIHEIVHDSVNPVIIVGDPVHPEVVGIKGWSGGQAWVIGSIEDFNELRLPKNKQYTIVAQTTFNYEKFNEIVEKIKSFKYDIKCFNTVCNATQERQSEAARVASNVDIMIVIGSKDSSNTKKLYDICKAHCKVTKFIQSVDDLNVKDLSYVERVGITAGASTPNIIIEEVQTYVRS